jgi:predicted lysophospholipase L1 biosynthesis ABC-type transport system permease subunit
MALGADRGQVMRMMIRRGMGTIAVGLALGVILALSLTRLMSGLLFAARAYDPLALGGAALLLTAAALFAIIIPARRAAKLDPIGRLAKRMRKSFLEIDWGDSTQRKAWKGEVTLVLNVVITSSVLDPSGP